MSVADRPDELNFSSFQAKSHFSACYYLLNLFNETSFFIVCSFHSCYEEHSVPDAVHGLFVVRLVK